MYRSENSISSRKRKVRRRNKKTDNPSSQVSRETTSSTNLENHSYSRFQNDRHRELFYTDGTFLSAPVLRGMRQPLRGRNPPRQVIRSCFFCTRSPDRAKQDVNKQETQVFIVMNTAVYSALSEEQIVESPKTMEPVFEDVRCEEARRSFYLWCQAARGMDFSEWLLIIPESPLVLCWQGEYLRQNPYFNQSAFTFHLPWRGKDRSTNRGSGVPHF
jgi:hypothetical protein